MAMKRLNQTGALAYFMLSKDLMIQNLSSLLLVLCHVAATKHHPVHHHGAYYIFRCFGVTEFILNHFKNRVPLKLVLKDVLTVAHFITGHERTQLNRVCRFISLLYSLLSKDLTIQNLSSYSMNILSAFFNRIRF